MNHQLIEKYFRQDMMPHIFCPGCGHGVLMKDIIVAIDRLNLEQDKICIVSGIGCSSRASGYMDFNTIHTTHGRAIAVATGIKMAKPDRHVIVITGDGDVSAIGGNHLIHAARRNINITVIVFNNTIYGMTGGQFSPTTPMGDYATTAPYGNIDQAFDIAQLAVHAGATFVARGTVYHVDKTTRLIERAILHRGFSLVDCASICPTYYGRKNKKGSAVAMVQWQKENAIDYQKSRNQSPEELKNKLLMGEIHHDNREEYTEKYDLMVRQHLSVQENSHTNTVRQ